MLLRFDRYVLRLFVMALAVIAAGIALASYHTGDRTEAAQLLRHTQTAIADLDATLSYLRDAEANELNFVLSASETMSMSFEEDGALALQHAGRVTGLFAEDAGERSRVDSLVSAVSDAVSGMRSTIAARREHGFDAAVQLAKSTPSLLSIRKVRDTVHALQHDAELRLNVREAILAQSSRHTSWVVFGLGGIAILILVVATATLTTARRRQRTAERDASNAHEELRLRLEELVWRGRDNTARQQLGEALQLCLTSGEAHNAIGAMLPAILGPTVTGGILATLVAGKAELEAVAGWGSASEAYSIAAIEFNQCCALRSGHSYEVMSGDLRMRCAHVARSSEPYICLPLVAQGETLGIVHVTFDEGSQPNTVAARIDLLKLISEQIAVVLANLAFRQRLQEQTNRDALTGTFNRRYLEAALGREILRERRYENGLALLMVDIDHFKRVNDQFGHEAGDDTLRAVGAFLVRGLRAEDTVCRYGGEEFAILLPNVTSETARTRANTILEGCRQLRVSSRQQQLGAVTISVGLAMLEGPMECGADVLRRADQALYVAKQSGRNRVVEAVSSQDAAALI